MLPNMCILRPDGRTVLAHQNISAWRPKMPDLRDSHVAMAQDTEPMPSEIGGEKHILKALSNGALTGAQ